MEYLLYALITTQLFLFAVIIGALIYASIYDWWHRRKYKTWILLQEDHTKPKRPAAK